MSIYDRWFVLHGRFVGWHCLSLGIHIDVQHGVLELHLPFLFLRCGNWYHWPDDRRFQFTFVKD